MRSAEVVPFEAGSGGMKGNIVRTMLPFISGHKRCPRVRGTLSEGALSARAAASEKRCRHRFGPPSISGAGDDVPVGGFIGHGVACGPGGSSIRVGLLARRLHLRGC